MAFHVRRSGAILTFVLLPFREVFPHVILVDGIALGGEQPVAVEPDAILSKLTDPFTAEYYGRVGGDLRPLVTNLIAGTFSRYSSEAERPAKGDLNSDLFPRDEYMVSLKP